MSIIETAALTKRFGETTAVSDVSLSVEPGEVFGLLGPNGAGKTTTVRMLLDLLHPSEGSARIFGLDSHQQSPEIRARCGNLPGDYSYDPRLSGREIVKLFAGLRGLGSLGRAEELAERFGAALDRPLGDLSRGNRQKIGLIQAAFHSPELLLLDEPTGSLDPLMQEEFLGFAKEERERGTTILLSSHELDEVERVCDRVGIIREGSLVAVENVADMKERSFRYVRVEFGSAVEAAELVDIEGVSELDGDGRRWQFKATGELDAIVKAISRQPVLDLEVVRPSLEELVLTYYETGGGD